ncbi:hypothetical protein EG68_10651 [Paragonimus skrjabini miyazakii]|uniref:Dynactin subunit 6 n=1 Tax=Paragonimus skrjabini miyazakii TaxID=59628 RepID=A0A8S9YHS2_9TREM|nr:hypothetical protein EG68_10651 [Paragonimus skrjabini miyazakii]
MDKTTVPSQQQPVLQSRNQIRIAHGAVVCSECELSGEVTIGANTIIHPKARIIAEAGPIHIGAFNLIEEQVQIINRVPDSVMKIGDHNVFEIGAQCEAIEVGDNNVLEAKSVVGPRVRITNGCVIGSMCSLTSDETLPECMVIYGEENLLLGLASHFPHQCHRRIASERPPAQTLQLDFLTKILPNYHHLMKASRTSAAGSTTHLLFDLRFVTMSSTMDESMSVLPGESGSVAELLGSSESLGQSGSGAPADAATATALTAAFNFTGTSASANGATMQEYFIESVVSSAQKFELLTTRLRGLCREWAEFCDQEISFQLSGDDRGDGSVPRTVSATPSGAAGVLTTAAHTSSNPSVSVRIRRSLLACTQLTDHKLCMLRYLGAVETDKLELGFDPEFTYVAQGQIFIRGRIKVCVYTVNEVTQFENSTGSVAADGSVMQDPLPKEWRRLCPRSWLVEISAVGSPADESLQEEVADFADMLHPLVIPAKIDHSLLTRK